METEQDQRELLQITSEIVAAFMMKNTIEQSEVPALIGQVHATLSDLSTAEPEAPPEPAVPVKRSVTREYLVCLECGRKLKMLKRHLATEHGMTPAEYRERWGLPANYPMVASAHSEKRQEIARKIGLGRSGSGGRRKKKAS